MGPAAFTGLENINQHSQSRLGKADDQIPAPWKTDGSLPLLSDSTTCAKLLSLSWCRWKLYAFLLPFLKSKSAGGRSSMKTSLSMRAVINGSYVTLILFFSFIVKTHLAAFVYVFWLWIHTMFAFIFLTLNTFCSDSQLHVFCHSVIKISQEGKKQVNQLRMILHQLSLCIM